MASSSSAGRPGSRAAGAPTADPMGGCRGPGAELPSMFAVLGVGAVTGGRQGAAALRARAGEAAEFSGDEALDEGLQSIVKDFKRATQQRYLDKAAETGLVALHGAIETAGVDQDRIDRDPGRVALSIATVHGPETTRQQYLGSYAQRGGKSASATLFSNCGYNIVGAMLARSRNIRGPVLTFGGVPRWPRQLLDTSRRQFAARRIDLSFVGYASAETAVIMALAPLAPSEGREAARLAIACPRGFGVEANPGSDSNPYGLLSATGGLLNFNVNAGRDGEGLFWRIAAAWWRDDGEAAGSNSPSSAGGADER